MVLAVVLVGPRVVCRRARSDEAGDALILDGVRDVDVGGVQFANRGLFAGEVDGPSGAVLVDGETLAAVDGRAGRASLAVELAVVHEVVQRARVDVVRLVVLLCARRRFGEDDAHVSKKRRRRIGPGSEARHVARARRGPKRARKTDWNGHRRYSAAARPGERVGDGGEGRTRRRSRWRNCGTRRDTFSRAKMPENVRRGTHRRSAARRRYP